MTPIKLVDPCALRAFVVSHRYGVNVPTLMIAERLN